MITQIINKIRLRTLILGMGCGFMVIATIIPSVLALDMDLWNLPKPPDSSIVWDDKRVQINGIDSAGTHLRSQSEVGEVINFYKEFFLGNGWQIKDDFKEQNVIAFTRKDRFMYVAGQSNGKDAPCDVYLISSPSDLALCKILARLMDKGIVMQEDAAGRDIPDIPRYPASKRMVSIFAPYEGAILLYQAAATPAEIIRFYQSQLEANGWELVRALQPEFLQSRVPELQNTRVLLFLRGNETLFINANLLPKEATVKEMTSITIVKNMLDEFAYPDEIKE
jgi:hypothetical protein